MLRKAAARSGFCIAVVLIACSDGTSPRADSTQTSQDAWARYKTISTQHAAADRALVDSELKATGQTSPTRAAYTDADFKIDGTMTDAWFAGGAAAAMSDAILSYQTPTGGWSKHIDYTAGVRKPGQSFYGETDSWDYIATIDNGATTTEITFLARENQVKPAARYRDAIARGFEYLLLAQQPTGCWPQVYPLMGGYHDAATYNDDAIVHVLSLLRDVGKGGIYSSSVSADLSARVAAALAQGIDCVVASQIVVSNVKTAWCQQHDAVTLAPVVGRSYELPGISGQESAGIVNFLMTISNPDARVVAAVHAAADWFKLTAINGYAYDASGYHPQTGAGPLWARIAEIGTNRPIFANRDGVKLYDFDQLTDRRTGYSWFGTAPAATLRTYATWALTHPR